ncbi:class I adenylate-forming enzyme family protein [Nocardia sp. R16R-3T]
MSHPDMLRRTARRAPEKLCVVEGERSLTFGEVDERADRLADSLVAAGHGQGQRVALLAGNELEYLEIIVACQRAGAVLVPLNTRFTVRELAELIEDAKPSLLICGSEFSHSAAELDVGAVWFLGADGRGEHYASALSNGARTLRSSPDPDAPATLLYTSGTTGRPKGALISNRAQLARSLALGIELQMSPSSVFLQMLPLFHLAQQFTVAYALMGGTNILMNRFDPQRALSEIHRRGVTDTLLVPTILKMLLAHPDFCGTDKSSLRRILYGGAPIDRELLVQGLSGFACDFYQMYGMTETGPATLLRPVEHDPERPELLRSAGSSIVTYEVTTADESGRSCPPGVPGEILLRGPGLMGGYWRRTTESDHALRDDWMHTGDTGYLDESGLLFVTDRVKDMIVTGGENVSPVEVEHVLLTHPRVADCAVVGAVDDHFGERVHAVVVVVSGTAPSAEGLEAYCRTRLAGYKVPRSWSFVNDLPRTATGKVRKNVLRESLGVA